MRLPNPAYDRGMSSLGREGRGAVTQYEVASRTNLDTQSAKNAVLQQFQKLGDAGLAWIQAGEQGEAEIALSDYRGKIRALEVTLDNVPAYKPDDIPSGIKFQRYESINGEQVEREYIPAYEVRTALFDFHEKQYRTDALSRPTGASKGKLLLGINEFQSQAVERQREGEFKGRLDYLTATRNQLIADSVQKGDIQTASIAIEQGVKLGLYSLDEGRQMIEKANVEHETLTFGRAITNAQTPEQLEALALEIPQRAQWLNPAQRFALSDTAVQRAAALDAKRTAQFEKYQTQASSQLRADTSLFIMQSGPIPWEAIEGMDLKPNDKIALLTFNKAAKDSRSTHDDPATASDIQARLLGLSMPSDVPAQQRAQALQADILAGLQSGHLTTNSSNVFLNRINEMQAEPVTSEGYKFAVDQGVTMITGGDKASNSFFGADPRAKQNALKFEFDLRAATLKGADPVAWMTANAGKYQVTATAPSGLSQYIIRNADGSLNKTKSIEAVTEARRANRISAEATQQLEDQINHGK